MFDHHALEDDECLALSRTASAPAGKERMLRPRPTPTS